MFTSDEKRDVRYPERKTAQNMVLDIVLKIQYYKLSPIHKKV